MKKIYKYYKERLVEISGRSRSLYSKKIHKKTAYDIGRIMDGDYDAINDFVDFLFHKKRPTYVLIDKASQERICRNLKTQDKIEPQFRDRRMMKKTESAEELGRRGRITRDEEEKTVQSQVNDLKTLKREIEDFSDETGRYEMFVGYPFVEGSIGREMIVRAPLLLFPVSIHIENETTAVLEKKINEPIQLNKVFLLAYAQRYRLNIDELITEFDNLSDAKFSNIDSVVNYLRKFGFKIAYQQRKGMFDFSKTKEPHLGDPIEIKQYAIIGRFPLANAIYNDYKQLENRKATNAIRELLQSRVTTKVKPPNDDLFAISSLDFSQEDAIGKLNQQGNMVIYGPPGTGKSQTIVNIITDALCKGRKVLVVSQKKAALEVVYNRLGLLADRAMYITDPEKNKVDFFTRTKNAHLTVLDDSAQKSNTDYWSKYDQIKRDMRGEVELLENISDILFKPSAFGLSLQEMYAKSYGFGKTLFDRTLYKKVLKSPKLLAFKYPELKNIVRVIVEKQKDELYYKKLQLHSENPLCVHVKNDLNVNAINSAKSLVNKILLRRRIVPFDMSKYSNARQVLAFYLENGLADEKDLMPVIRLVAKLENKPRNEVAASFVNAMAGIREYVSEYASLEKTLDKQGFAMVVEGIINGNSNFLRMLKSALDNYVYVREINQNVQELTSAEKVILNFCFENTTGIKEFKEAVRKIIPARIYHEIVIAEEQKKNGLAKIMDYENIKNRILSLKGDQKKVVMNICLEMFKKNYGALYNSAPENKNFFYQISKDKNFWPIRKLIEVYGDLMLTLFPCWLLSPEGVSTLLPLQQGLFDLVLFDEASQVFIENTLPAIYRSRYIAVAGDSKQLRPTALFMRRYMGSDISDLDLDTQAALEVDSLLDLATSRYNSVNLNYHYRSQSEELITFSNYAFYDCKLQVAPNLTKNINSKPIERIKVSGTWADRRNIAEAQEVIRLLKKIFRTRKENETIGIITFNAEQESYIEDLIDKECRRDEAFREIITKERIRKDNGESVGLFTKNLENVQGDERDIIIFSIGYARNEYGKVISHFGPLNIEGGENRLNVAITRAKKKEYVITSIEPEELDIEGTKNMGPKIFKKYLEYVRAVSDGRANEVALILDSLRPQTEGRRQKITVMQAAVKSALEKLGYTVEVNLGNNSYKLSLAVYDKKLDRFLVGIEFDDVAYRSSPNVLERDVFRGAFMESRGWTMLRIWSRDFWLSPAKLIERIDKAAKKSREIIIKKII